MDSTPQSGAGGWHSLERRLPVLVSLLLVAVVAVLSLIAYRALEDALLRAAGDHTERVAGQLSSVLAQSTGAVVREVAAVAELPEVAAIARGSTAPGDDAERALAELARRRPQIIGIGVRTDDPGWRFWADGPAVDSIAEPPRHRNNDRPDGVGVGPIRVVDGSLFYDVTARVPAPTERADSGSWIVVRWRIAERQAGQVLSEMVGEDGVFLVGSQDVDAAWTDLAQPIAAPETRRQGEYVWNGAVYHGALVDVPATAWQVWAAIPRSVILGPAGALASRMAVTGAFILLLGTGAALLLGRHLSRPIARLTRAVEAMSSGRRHERVPEGRRDELGRLAASYNVMADRIEDATQNLEAEVAQRTSELEAALNELREAQEQLVRREKLAMLGQLASGVGHELRNPLGVMTNAVYYLDMVSPDATPDVKEYLGILRAQLGLAEKIVADLLDFARIKPPQRDVVPLEHLLEEQLARLGNLNGVRVERDYDPASPAARVDGVQVGQVLFNLLTNAVQAMSESGGRMIVRTRSVPGEKVAVAVSDTGPGIPAADLERIFEPLYTTKARGIGLGLAVSRSLVEANEGELRVESRPGAGATFTVTLPAA